MKIAAMILAYQFIIIVCLFSASSAGNQRVGLRNYGENEKHQVKDAECDNSLPTALFRNTDKILRREYMGMLRRVQGFYSAMPPGSLIETDIFTTLPEGTFIFWGMAARGLYEMSCFNNETIVESDTGNGGSGVTWRFIPPQSKDMTSIKKSYLLTGDHIVFVGPKFEIFAHFFLDSLGYISYLREVMPLTTRLLLPDVGGNARSRLEVLDKDFAKRVDWIECEKAFSCNQLISIKDGTLTILRPKSGTRHIDLLYKAREWILEKKSPKPSSLTDRTIVYYTRNARNAGHGRAIDVEQESVLLDIIKQNMLRYSRPEKLVVFDGIATLEEQIDLFQSANVVIGAHGGGLANLIFTLPSETCGRRPKVLEFLSNELTPGVQAGSMSKTYYHLYSTCPWVDYYHVLYVPPSSEEKTYVDLQEFEDAVRLIFGEDQQDLLAHSSKCEEKSKENDRALIHSSA